MATLVPNADHFKPVHQLFHRQTIDIVHPSPETLRFLDIHIFTLSSPFEPLGEHSGLFFPVQFYPANEIQIRFPLKDCLRSGCSGFGMRIYSPESFTMSVGTLCSRVTSWLLIPGKKVQTAARRCSLRYLDSKCSTMMSEIQRKPGLCRAVPTLYIFRLYTFYPLESVLESSFGIHFRANASHLLTSHVNLSFI